VVQFGRHVYSVRTDVAVDVVGDELSVGVGDVSAAVSHMQQVAGCVYSTDGSTSQSYR